VTRTLYDSIWSEFCDWGLELAKARLGDASLSDAEREATWWTLVESLDVFVRLLHPVMPFVTEALWAALPHVPEDPELLIVASWPVARPRDADAEAAVGEILELVTGIRNARAEAGIDPGAWLDGRVAVPPALGEAVAALAPAIERLARIRPLAIVESGSDQPANALAVVAGRLEASVSRPPSAAAGRDRERIERELAGVEKRLADARTRLADPAFTGKAPPHIVEGARALADELEMQAQTLRAKLRA
jgi:valyl-tRNA synthetase